MGEVYPNTSRVAVHRADGTKYLDSELYDSSLGTRVASGLPNQANKP